MISKHIFIGLTGVVLLAGCGKHDDEEMSSEPAAPPVAVFTESVQVQPLWDEEEVVGNVEAAQRSVLSAKVTGVVDAVNVAPGAKVTRGQVLATIDAREIRARLDSAAAAQDQARKDFARIEKLLQSGSSTRQEFDAVTTRLRTADAALVEARTMLQYTEITAPFDGVVTRKLADIGDLAMPGKPLLEIESPTALRFEADLPEAILDRVQLGAKLPVRLAKVIEGTVSEISPVADPVSRTFRIKLDLPAVEGLRTGQFGRVSVPVAAAQLLLVPREAVLKRGQMELVFVARDGRAVLRLVKTGKSLDGRVAILSGLEAGEAVIVSDTTRLIDGQPVTPQP